MDYPQRLLNINVKLLEPIRPVKQHHSVQCMVCDHTWSATPLSLVQVHHKWGTNGCPSCAADRTRSARSISRAHNVKQILDKGLEILSDWDGRRVSDAQNTQILVTVRNTKCGHTFTSTAVNLLTRDIECSVCGILNRTGNINHWSELNSAKWRQTAPAWKVYRAEVTKLTRLTYRTHRATINPHNLPTGLAGTEGAYHLDHIVPVRWCFIRNVPPEIVADVTNLEMIPWRENIVHRDNLKGDLPLLFHPYHSVDPAGRFSYS